MEAVDPPQILEPGAGETIRPGYEIKVGRTELVMTESLYAPGQAGPDPHIHRHHADAFWVLEGRLLVQIGSDDHFVDAGGFALAPPEVVHSFRNPGPGPARFLNIHAPGMGFDEYVRSGYEFDFDQEDPPADGGRPASEAIVLAAGEGRRLTLGESSVTIKAGAGDALGSFALMELDFAPGMPTPRPPPPRANDRQLLRARGRAARASGRPQREPADRAATPMSRPATRTPSRPSAAGCGRST